jgi:hypothetical protein
MVELLWLTLVRSMPWSINGGPPLPSLPRLSKTPRKGTSKRKFVKGSSLFFLFGDDLLRGWSRGSKTLG